MPTEDSAPPSTIENLKAIIRRDLNLGADEVIDDDMPLVGGDMDLDSLDILMLVTSVEKQFGIKVTSEQHGQEAFASVASLASFIERSASSAGAGPAAAQDGPADLSGALGALPHQPPFRFVTDLASLSPGRHAVGHWRVTGEEPFFAGHFPGRPLVPGVLLAEALAQLSGIAFAAGGGGSGAGRLAGVDVRFRAPVAPPATIELTSTLSKSVGDLHVFEVAARSAGQTVAEGAVTLHQAGQPPTPEA